MERKTAACKISDKDFRDWLGKISRMSRRDCRQLQDSRIAEQFLIAWHFLETICFGKNCAPTKFKKFSKSYTRKHSFKLDATFQHFYDRYQDATKLRQLMHKHLRNQPHIGDARGRCVQCGQTTSDPDCGSSLQEQYVSWQQRLGVLVEFQTPDQPLHPGDADYCAGFAP